MEKDMNFSLGKKMLLVVLCATLLAVCPVLAGDQAVPTTDPVDTKNIAVVNGTPILQTDFDTEFNQFKNRLHSATATFIFSIFALAEPFKK